MVMANISSQKKRIRQDEKKNLRNKDKKTALRSSIKAILNSDLGLNPSTSGDLIRVTMPALTEETRQDYIKVQLQK